MTHRRLIIELHSEWGLPRSFYADVRLLRELYEPLGCKVTLATVLRHPFSFYLSWFNWRASNYMPLCTWDHHAIRNRANSLATGSHSSPGGCLLSGEGAPSRSRV